ncbi:MAG: hypothetical protein R3B13_05615 [Polyangiaceae bacterium]
MTSERRHSLILSRLRSGVPWSLAVLALAGWDLRYAAIAALVGLCARCATDDKYAVATEDGTFRVLRSRGLRAWRSIAELPLAAAARIDQAGSTLAIRSAQQSIVLALDSGCEAATVASRISEFFAQKHTPCEYRFVSGRFAPTVDTRAPILAALRLALSAVCYLLMAKTIALPMGLFAAGPIITLLRWGGRTLADWMTGASKPYA